MDPLSQICLTVQAACGMLTEMFKWLQTPDGSAFVKQMNTDRKNWDDFWAGFGKQISMGWAALLGAGAGAGKK